MPPLKDGNLCYVLVQIKKGLELTVTHPRLFFPTQSISLCKLVD